MRMALREAEAALAMDEVPVGAVVVQGDKVLGRAHNQRETLRDPTAHAEMIVLTQAAAALDAWRLLDTTLYVTLEPCVMCAGALVGGRVTRLVYGARDKKAGGCGSLYDIVRDDRLNHRLVVDAGILEDECTEILKGFFARRRPGGPSDD